jgi:hypothetical protein
MAKTGPKPKVGLELGLKHQDRLNYTILKVLDDKVFKVKCNSCSEVRVFDLQKRKGVENSYHRCQCTKTRNKYGTERTPKFHTTELKHRGYECTKVGKQQGDKFESSAYNTYRHICGREFKMTWCCFRMCIEPCEVCRVQNGVVRRVAQDYEDRVRKKGKGRVQVLDKYIDRFTELRFKYKSCGHVVKRTYEWVRTRRFSMCPVCYPNQTHFRFKLRGKSFMTRSVIEKEFVKRLVAEGKADVDDIIYEPRSHKIEYFDPIQKRYRRYEPDFLVNVEYAWRSKIWPR